MKRWLLGSALLYAALMAFCGFGAELVPESAQRALEPYFWLLGPPANLVHGTDFLWPFAIGTVAVAGCVLGSAYSESPGVQVTCGIGLLLTWAVCGFLVYAPGA